MRVVKRTEGVSTTDLVGRLLLMTKQHHLASPALAADRYGLAGGPPDRSNLPVDPEILPPDTRPGECVNRRVTGPGGAYRWERVECDDGERVVAALRSGQIEKAA